MKTKKLIIFDLDGVLVNSIGNMEYALNKTNEIMKLNLKFNKYKKYLGLPFKSILKKIGVRADFKRIEKLYKHFSNENIGSFRIKKSYLKELYNLKEKYNLAIFTSKDRLRTKKILSGIKCFSYIVSGDEVIRGKPHPEGIYKILRKTKTNRKNVIYIGDSIYDYKASKKAKVKYLHAKWGYDQILNKKKNITKISKISDIKRFLNYK